MTDRLPIPGGFSLGDKVVLVSRRYAEPGVVVAMDPTYPDSVAVRWPHRDLASFSYAPSLLRLAGYDGAKSDAERADQPDRSTVDGSFLPPLGTVVVVGMPALAIHLADGEFEGRLMGTTVDRYGHPIALLIDAAYAPGLTTIPWHAVAYVHRKKWDT